MLPENDGGIIKILLADDDQDDREFFEEAVTLSGLSASLATVKDGEELMKYLANIHPDHPSVIFLDINMPCMNGRDCLKGIRQDPTLNDVPVIMFSTSSYSKDIHETLENGANLYMPKPVFFHDEVKILKYLFSGNWKDTLLSNTRERYVFEPSRVK